MSESKVIILTGASRGIGLAIALYLLKQQHRLVAVARSQGPLDELAAQFPGQVAVLAGDVSDYSLGQKAVDLAHSTWQRLDSVIVNHGVLEPVAKLADADPNEWAKAFQINFFSAVGIVKAALPDLRQNKGRIVLCSSGAASDAYIGWGAYGSTKAALNHLAATLAVEEPEVTSVAIRPGIVDTNMQVNIRGNFSSHMGSDGQKFHDIKASGKLLRPEQPGHVMAKLAVSGPEVINGKFLSWNSPELEAFQEE